MIIFAVRKSKERELFLVSILKMRKTMQKYADYIKQIEIDSLWSGTKHILWNLDRRVNILSGVNGVGKSTILNKVVKGLAQGGEFPSHLLKGVHLQVEPEEAKWIRYDVIRSVDRPLMNAEIVSSPCSRVVSRMLPKRHKP